MERQSSEPQRPEKAPASAGTTGGELPAAGTNQTSGDKPAAKPPLTAEEQMALYEENLKENDWGHQPC